MTIVTQASQLTGALATNDYAAFGVFTIIFLLIVGTIFGLIIMYWSRKRGW